MSHAVDELEVLERSGLLREEGTKNRSGAVMLAVLGLSIGIILGVLLIFRLVV